MDAETGREEDDDMTDLIKLGEYMTALRVPLRGHDAYMIRDRHCGALCLIEWFPRWRRWVVTSAEDDAVFSADCLRDLAAALERLNDGPLV